MKFGLIKEITIVRELMNFNMLMIIKIMMKLLPVFVSNNGKYLTIHSSWTLISKLVQMVKTRVNLSIAKFGLNINFTWLL